MHRHGGISLEMRAQLAWRWGAAHTGGQWTDVAMGRRRYQSDAGRMATDGPRGGAVRRCWRFLAMPHPRRGGTAAQADAELTMASPRRWHDDGAK